MIVEFIGSSGAGKTTLVSEVQGRLAQSAKVATSFDLIAEVLNLRRVTNATVRNLIGDLVGFPFFVRSMRRHQALMNLALRILAHPANFTFLKLNTLRGIVRKIGSHEIMRRYEKDRIVLVDEGTVHLAHYLFVFITTCYRPEDIVRFASLVPLPEVVVYVKVPVKSLVQRSLQRSDPPREMRSKNPALVEGYIGRASQMFDQLVETEAIRPRVLTVENPTRADGERDPVADQIAEFILSHEAAGGWMPLASARQVESAPPDSQRHVIQTS